MALLSAGQTFPTALSRDADSWLYNTEFMGVSQVFSNGLDDMMQDVPNLAFSNDPIESGTGFTPHFVHDLHATQLEPGQGSFQALVPAQAPPNHVSSFNKEANSKSSTSTPVTDTYLFSATNRVKGSARIGKAKKYSRGASASSIRKRTRQRKAHLLKGFALLEKAREALQPYSELPRNFTILLESSFSQLEKIVEEAICSDDMSDSSSTPESSNLEMDSAYESFSDVSLSKITNSVHEEQNINFERQTTGPTPSRIGTKAVDARSVPGSSRESPEYPARQHFWQEYMRSSLRAWVHYHGEDFGGKPPQKKVLRAKYGQCNLPYSMKPAWTYNGLDNQYRDQYIQEVQSKKHIMQMIPNHNILKWLLHHDGEGWVCKAICFPRGTSMREVLKFF